MATKLERLRALLPPDGTDLVQIWGAAGPGIDTGGLIAPDATVRFVAPSAEISAEGPEGFRERWADWLQPWQSFRMYTDEILERGDRVITLTRLCGVTKRDGVEIEKEAAAVFHFDGDQVVEVEFNLDRQDALAD